MGRDVGDTTQGVATEAGLVPSPDRKLVLVTVLSDGAIREFDMPNDGTVDVGRSSSATVFIDDPSVSRHHAEIGIGPGGPIVRDLDSRNGTYINDERVSSSFVGVLLGDTIRFGNVSALFHNTPVIDDAGTTRQIEPRDLDQRMTDEGERCLRFDRSLSLMIIEFAPPNEATAESVRALVSSELRAVDVFAMRGPGRIDVLLTECAGDEARACAGRIDAALRNIHVAAKLGIANFPGDAASIDRLPVIAGMVMRAAGERSVAAATDGARMFHLGSRDVIVADPAMVRLFGLVQRAATTPVPVLIVGESGTGKSVVAEALHLLGPRRDRPFVRVSCSTDAGGVPEAFGRAAGGTLVLDEIDKLPAAAQIALRDAMESGGGDVRVVGATTEDLDGAAERDSFRRDLLYLLKGLVLQVPPLRDRPKEIRLLAERFAAELAGAPDRSISLAPTAFTALRRHSWPGNIRELRTAIGNAVIAADGDQIELDDLMPDLGTDAPTVDLPLDASVRKYERSRIEEALAACGGNQTQAAKLLHIPRRTLVSKLRAHGIEGPLTQRRRRASTDSGDMD